MREEKGFTLVELAVVMIIVGLLIGGILKGQEMIANAQVTSTVAQAKAVDAAFSTFRDMYDAVPGDMTTPAARLPGCNAGTQCVVAGDGNSRVGTPATFSAVAALGTENTAFWAQLSAADLITGIDTSTAATANWGSALPSSKIAGGFKIGYETGDGTNAGTVGLVAAAAPRGGHYLALTGAPAVAVGGAGSDVLTASKAARVDRKMDDGLANTGSVRAAAQTAANCATAGGIYNEATDAVACSLYIRIQG